MAKLRGILRQKKIGHTGTLDPQAKGVLPVCLGNATKVSGLLTDRSKSYQVVGLLGTVTDTQDIHGKVIESKRVDIKKYDLIQTIKSFVGEYNQIPPMYSAIKIDGKKLYDYARQGKEVERKPRKVFIDSIEILDINMDAGEFKLLVDCSKGTYIRTLVHDIGQKLACGACMKDLLRTRVGEFNLSSSKTLSQIEEHFTSNTFDSILTKVDELFPEYEKVSILEEYSKVVYNGNVIFPNNIKGFNNGKKYDKVRVYDWQDNFVAIYQYDQEKEAFKPFKMFL